MTLKGYITEVHEGSHCSAVVFGNNSNRSDWKVTFNMEALALQDRKLLQPGRVFTWRSGDKYLTLSQEVWTPEELAEVKRRAAERAEVWNNTSPAFR